MADVKISELPELSTIATTDELPIVSSGTTYKITGNTLGYTDTGEFTTTTLVAGNVYISDNIVTPLPLITVNSYGQPVTTNQPLLVNGNLSVTGSVTTGTVTDTISFNSTSSVGGDRAAALSAGYILDVGKRYRFPAAGAVILPSITGLSVGDSIEVLFLNSSAGYLNIYVYESATDVVIPTYLSGFGFGSTTSDGGYAGFQMSANQYQKAMFTLYSTSGIGTSYHWLMSV